MELTNKQKTILECLYEGGFRYLATDERNKVYAYVKKPLKEKPSKYDGFWMADEGDFIFFNDCFDPKLTKWEDEEPLNIKKALGIVDWSTIPIDTKVLVKNKDGKEWRRRYFAKYTNGKVYTWIRGTTSWSVDNDLMWEWDEAKLADEEM